MRHHKILSAIAANRKQFFDLVETLELECSCKVDEVRLTGHIDSEFDGRTELTADEANGLLMLVSCAPGRHERA